MKLVSMLAFVLARINVAGKSHTEILDEIRAYALFLKQVLTLGMFVPCDEKGNVLKKPQFMDFFWGGEYEPHEEKYKICERYQQALDRVLFKGFVIKKYDPEAVRFDNLNHDAILYNPESGTYVACRKKGKWTINKPSNRVLTVNDIVSSKIELTEAAEKQIGLK